MHRNTFTKIDPFIWTRSIPSDVLARKTSFSQGAYVGLPGARAHVTKAIRRTTGAAPDSASLAFHPDRRQDRGNSGTASHRCRIFQPLFS